MPDKDVSRQEAYPAFGFRSETEIIFLAIALAKRNFIEVPDFVQTASAYIHAEAYTGRDLNQLAPVYFRRDKIKFTVRQLKLHVVILDIEWITAYLCIIRERGNGAGSF
jgi:hypothetical protein